MRQAAFASAELPATLRDGRTVAIRRSTPADELALREFLAGLCLEARRLRFFTGAVDVERAAHEGAASPGQVGLLALGEDGALLGHALFVPLPGPGQRAEVAAEVADELHGQGLGTILIERLAEIAERRGIELLVAEVLPDNRAMLEVLRDGFDAEAHWDDGVERVEFPASAWRLAQARYVA